MKRKSFILLLLTVFVLSISSLCFATDNTANNIKNTVNGATNTVVDGMQNLAEDTRNGIGTAENAIENTAGNIGNALMNDTNYSENNANNEYRTIRTSAEDITNTNGMDTTVLTWIVLAIAAMVIVGLVWYYSSEHNHKD